MHVFYVSSRCWSLPDSPVHSLLPPGRSGHIGSAGHILTHSCVFIAIFTWFEMQYASVHMFSVPAQLLGSTLLHLPISTGKFHVFIVYQHILMGYVISAVVSVPFQMSGMSLCSLDTSDQFPRPSVTTTSRLASLASNFMPVLSPSPKQPVFNFTCLHFHALKAHM